MRRRPAKRRTGAEVEAGNPASQIAVVSIMIGEAEIGDADLSAGIGDGEGLGLGLVQKSQEPRATFVDFRDVARNPVLYMGGAETRGETGSQDGSPDQMSAGFPTITQHHQAIRDAAMDIGAVRRDKSLTPPPAQCRVECPRCLQGIGKPVMEVGPGWNPADEVAQISDGLVDSAAMQTRGGEIDQTIHEPGSQDERALRDGLRLGIGKRDQQGREIAMEHRVVGRLEDGGFD